MKEMPNLHNFHVSDVLKTIREALFIFPEHRDLQKIFVTCMGSIILSNNIDKVSTIF
jgi:hypothetical protein